ncbi:MAG: LCP family protein [Propionibacteriaceae bacterium]|jgi:LCP family protein required for cell wall assembly|nr:LCP family protein [Propionibacteriaceae bacterium]
MGIRFHRPRVRTIVLIVLAVVLVVAGVVGFRVWSNVRAVLPGGGETAPVNGRYNVLLIGSDSADWRDGARADSTTVVSVDAVTGRTLMISIPRNLVRVPFVATSPLAAKYPDGYVCPNQATEPCMLTMAYQTGLDNADLYPGSRDPGSQAMIDAVEGITGLTMNYYAFIDMDGFEQLIDALGGIDLDIRARVPVGALGQTAYWIEPGPHHFSGEEALWYVRTRVNTDDYARMVRQKCVMLAAVNSLDPSTLATHFLSLSDAATQMARTNIPVGQVTTLTGLASKATTWTVSGLSLTPPLIDPLNPDYAQIRTLVAGSITEVEGLDQGGSGGSGTSGSGGTSGTGKGTSTSDLTTTCGL